ncbi:hypothetical protein FRC08_005395 [Ceratobasidium sp. 394]|nr:hypothetical protein FRC08_005395 [Ceratobasidium sp. 394]
MDHVPELVLDPPSGLAGPRATAPFEPNPTQAFSATQEPIPIPDPAAIPVSPSIRTDIPYLSANSVLPSPDDLSS